MLFHVATSFGWAFSGHKGPLQWNEEGSLAILLGEGEAVKRLDLKAFEGELHTIPGSVMTTKAVISRLGVCRSMSEDRQGWDGVSNMSWKISHQRPRRPFEKGILG